MTTDGTQTETSTIFITVAAAAQVLMVRGFAMMLVVMLGLQGGVFSTAALVVGALLVVDVLRLLVFRITLEPAGIRILRLGREVWIPSSQIVSIEASGTRQLLVWPPLKLACAAIVTSKRRVNLPQTACSAPGGADRLGKRQAQAIITKLTAWSSASGCRVSLVEVDLTDDRWPDDQWS